MPLNRLLPSASPRRPHSHHGRSHGHSDGSVLVRLAQPTDADALAPLCGQLDRKLTPGDVAARLAQHSANGDYATWIAHDADGAVFGFACGHLVSTITQRTPVAHLTALVTDAHARGRGVGSALIEAFDDWASAAGSRNAVYSSDGRGHGTHRSLDAYGFEKLGFRFSKDY